MRLARDRLIQIQFSFREMTPMDDYNLDDFFSQIEERKNKKDPMDNDTPNKVSPEVEHLMAELSDYQPEN